jgi:homocysteine S-methyltransferase
MFSIVKSMYKEGVYLSAQPAAGIPTLINGRALYHTSPEYLGQYALELLQSGVTLIGACCGSTPAHIAAMRVVLDEYRQAPSHAVPRERPRPSVSIPDTAAPGAQDDDHSRFSRAVGTRLLTTVELDVPRGLDMSSVLDGARFLQKAGIDAINVTDGARARLRISSIALSNLVQRDVGIETMTHLATRDRNMIGLQAELLGAHALGLRNILAVTGDPTNIGDYPQATSVFDIDSSGLIRAAKAMNKGLDLMGNDIGRQTSFFVACAVNASASNMDQEIAKVARKVEAGADILFTQPIYELKTLERLLKRLEPWRIPVMLGLLPLRSYKHAEFLHNEIPGMSIPGTIRDDLRRAEKKAADVGIAIATAFLQQAKQHIAGVYLMPPFQKYQIVPQILEAAGIRPGKD